MTDDFRRAIEEIKQRVPIEDVVREHVPDLRKAGVLWTACCPFHEEKTPSFKVDPRKGTWFCYGACAEGGDQIAFVQRITGLDFLDALEILAARTGVEVPKTRGRRDQTRRDDPAWEILARVRRYYSEVLASAEGTAGRGYLERRGLTRETVEGFGLGWAPASGQALVEYARREQLPWELLAGGGLVRKDDRGRPYDFFRGRLMIPIRDLEGRTVGFGARRLSDEAGGPKYINTAETPLFKKSRLVYGLDRALREARQARHLILVEGYTDVMAAHQVGLERVGAVLGTATTSDHASVIRRAGARRISLVFDGDAAGRQAARRALPGLLPLEVDIEVVTLPAGEDPCDCLLGRGAEAFLALVEAGQDWFQFLLEDLEGKSGAALSAEVDGVLELLALLARPVHRQSLLVALARHLGLPPETLREQWRTSEAGRRQRRTASEGSAPVEPPVESGPREPEPVDPGEVRAFGEAVGAVLLDSSLVPLLRPYVERCQDVGLRQILEVVLEMYEDVDAVIDESTVLSALEDHPARDQVVRLAASASRATSPRELLEGSLECLRRSDCQRLERELRSRFEALEDLISKQPAGDAVDLARAEQDRVLAELHGLYRTEKTPSESGNSLISQAVE